LAGRRLAWLHHQLGKPDIPVAVGAETGGPGDDVQIDLGFFKFEAQAKKGLRVGPRLDETIDRFGRALAADLSSRGVIVVDQTTSHPAVKDQLRIDLQRLRDGRDDDLKEVTIRVLGRLAALNVSNPKEVASRISVVYLDLEESGGAHSEVAQVLLRDRLEKRLGRPPRMVNVERVAEMRAQGRSWRQISRELRVGVGTAREAFARRAKNLSAMEHENA